MILAFVQQANVSPEQAAEIRRIVAAFMMLIPVFYVVSAFIQGLPYWFICKKAGFSPWLSLLFLIPVGGLVLSYVVGFAEWKTLAPPPGWMPPSPYPPPPPPATPQPSEATQPPYSPQT